MNLKKTMNNLIDEITNTEAAVWHELCGEPGKDLKEMCLDQGEEDFHSASYNLGPNLLSGDASTFTAGVGGWVHDQFVLIHHSVWELN